MATGGPPLKKELEEADFRHTCSLCMEPYRGRSPKILPCFHTFCLPCLTALQHSVQTATSEKRKPQDGNQPATEDEQKQPAQLAEPYGGTHDEEVGTDTENKAVKADVTKDGNDVTSNQSDGDKAEFLCPTCRAPVIIPDEGVAALQTNFYLDHEASPEETPPPAVCDICEEGNQQHAAHVCQQCQLRMCTTCRRCHDVLMRDHHVTSLSLGQSRKKNGEKKGFCLVHRDQVLCFHCRQCDVSICLHCKLTSHEGHATVDLVSAALQARKEVTSLVNSAQQQFQMVESSLRRVERDERQLTRDVQKVTQQVSARYDTLTTSLMTWATQSRDEMLEEVKVKEDSARSQLRTEKTAATVTMETLSNLVSRSARVTGNDPDAVLLRNELRAALLSEDRLAQYRQQADRQEALWEFNYDVTEASLMQQDEVQAYIRRRVKGGAEDDTCRPPSLRELADRFDRLSNHVTETNTDVTTNITNMMSQLTTCRDDMSTALKKTEADLQSKTTSLTDDVATMKKTEADLQSKTTSLTDDVATMKKTEADLQSKTTSLTDDVATMKKIEADLQSKTTSLTDDVATMKKTEADGVQSKTTSLSTSVTDVLKKMTTLADDVTLLKKSEAEITKVNTELKDKIGKAGKMVSFCVTGLNHSKTNQYKPMVFSNVKVNEGGCYDNTTGVFTAPVKGTYVFTSTMRCSKSDDYVRAYIQVDGTNNVFICSTQTSTGSGSVSVQLGVGQKEWVQAWDVPSIYYSSENSPSFTGVLVQPQL